MECKNCGEEMYHVEPNNVGGYFKEAYTCSECNLAYDIEKSLSGKKINSKWINLSEKKEASE